jgi:hypothetical protein
LHDSPSREAYVELRRAQRLLPNLSLSITETNRAVRFPSVVEVRELAGEVPDDYFD